MEDTVVAPQEGALQELIPIPASCYLERKFVFIATFWNKRWFAFDPDQLALMWFSTPSSFKRRGLIDIDRCKVEKKNTKGHFEFEITTRGGKKFSLRAPSAGVRKEWITGIKNANRKGEKIMDLYKGEECLNCIALAVADAPEETIEEEEENEGSAGNKLLSLEIKSMENQTVTFSGALTKPLALVALLRHFG